MTAPRSIPALQYPVEADILLPGSKSVANRALICAVLAEGTTIIRNATPCDDVDVMVGNLQKMGFDVRWEDRVAGTIRINGGIPRSPLTAHRSPLDCHNAGTTLRFLTVLACLVPGDWTITGDEHMRTRPVGDLVSALRSLGAEIEDTSGCPPIRIRGALRGGSVKLKATMSSQFLSSLLLVAPMLKEGLTIELDGPLASSGYVELTRNVMEDFGVKVEQKGSAFIVHPGTYQPRPSGYAIEGDWSAAGAWLVLNALTGSRIHCTNLDDSSAQSDRKIVDAIGTLKGTGDVTIDASQIPDQVMNLAALASLRTGKTTINGAKNLRLKECDRLAVTVENFRKLGIQIEEHPDGLIIQGKLPTTHYPLPTTVLDPHADHRMVMAFAILGLLHGNVSIADPDCVAKSYPGFFDDLDRILRSPRPIVIVGMRGVGKSSLGRRLASKLKLQHVDSDHLIVKEHGEIRAFVQEKGWPHFRNIEEETIAAALKPGVVLSLGGGATESAKTRTLLRDRAIVIWLQANDHALIGRLRRGKRPALTDLPLDQEVKKLQRERAPHYQEVASIVVGPRVRFSEQILTVMRGLVLLAHQLLKPSGVLF